MNERSYKENATSARTLAHLVDRPPTITTGLVLHDEAPPTTAYAGAVPALVGLAAALLKPRTLAEEQRKVRGS